MSENFEDGAKSAKTSKFSPLEINPIRSMATDLAIYTRLDVTSVYRGGELHYEPRVSLAHL